MRTRYAAGWQGRDFESIDRFGEAGVVLSLPNRIGALGGAVATGLFGDCDGVVHGRPRSRIRSLVSEFLRSEISHRGTASGRHESYRLRFSRAGSRRNDYAGIGEI